MHDYSAFWLKEEFRYHYFYKSDILYRFLTDYLTNKSTKDYLDYQFNYIAREIPYNQVVSHLKRYHRNRVTIEVTGNQIHLTMYNKRLSIFMDNKKFAIICHSVEEADILLFQPLKTFDPNFFIVEKGTTNSGWICPVKKEVLL